MSQGQRQQPQQTTGQNELEQYSHPYGTTDSSHHPSIAYPPSSYGHSTLDRSYHHPPRTLSPSSTLADTTVTPQTTPPASRPNPYRATEQSTYPWDLHSATSSATLEPYSSSSPAAYQSSISDRRRLISSFHSWNSQSQSSNMDPHDFDQFTAIELHNNQNKTTEHPLQKQSGTQVNLASAPSSPRLNAADASTKIKKRKFWSSFPRRFTFRPAGVVRPKKADSNGNKKAMFSNERTMVHWIKAAMLLGSLAMTLLSFGDNNVTPFIGVALLVICLMTLIYSTTIFQVRMEWLSMRRDDVIYYDRFAPTVLTIFVMATFGFNGLVIYLGDFKTNKDFYKHKHM